MREKFRESPHFFSDVKNMDHGSLETEQHQELASQEKTWKCHTIPEYLSIHLYLELKPY